MRMAIRFVQWVHTCEALSRHSDLPLLQNQFIHPICLHYVQYSKELSKHLLCFVGLFPPCFHMISMYGIHFRTGLDKGHSRLQFRDAPPVVLSRDQDPE